ncbi:hypothetical protein LS73_002175 [Helicobacter muridarum]|uniref:Uncharacterized protein n=1 Tax=Helicobacter muridarum TaxID=216 RepID=A0A099U1T6_9HELI|nr:hypothetical protein [Helicobacter muridarum]TLE01105.1 hypothetical protein LS73_002175 [Helicobacter muridarum]STQ85969.1 Uncharacterised protein [Helicobacter muridarum]
MDYLTARIISEAGYGKLQGDIDKDLQQEILISNKANENEVSQSKQNFTNLLKPQGTQNNPLASNVRPQAKDNSTLQNLGRNVININDNSLQATQDSTIAKPNPTSTYNSNIVLSSDPNFKPQTSQFANLKDSKNSNSTPFKKQAYTT